MGMIMKRMIMCSLLLVAGFVNCEEQNAETSATESQSSKYQDYLKVLEISQKNREVYKAINLVAEETYKLLIAKSECEKNGYCESSEEFSRLFDNVVKLGFELEDIQKEANFESNQKEIKDIFEKYRNDQ
jgi:hypothetical protein